MNNLLMEVENEVAVVTINRPKSLNALNSETLAELDQCFGEIAERKDIRVVILTGSGTKAFVAGDVGSGILTIAVKQFQQRRKLFNQVTIAAVNGYALGGGCEISMACDIRVASDNAKFGQPETGLGILPGFGGTQRLPRLVGKGRAKELIFTCDQIDAQEAYRIGLANKVVPQEELLDTCKAMAKKIMSKGSYAVSLAKQAINTGMDTDLASGLTLEANLFGLSFSTDDKKEGMTAFLEKRKANLTDF